MARSIASDGRRWRLPRPALRVLAPLLAVGAVGGCDSFGPRSCPTSIEPAVMVEVVNAPTGLPAASGAVGVVRDGAYVDSLRPGIGAGDGTLLALAAAFGCAGTYRVEVSRAGYAAWARDGVRSRRGDCGVVTTHVRAELVPSAASRAALGDGASTTP